MTAAEKDIQIAIMNMLMLHHKVSWAMVTTTGTMRRKGSYISVGIPGLPDILGQAKRPYGGVTIAIEVKKPGEKPTELQAKFLDLIRANGGIAGWCDSVEGAIEILR